MKKELIISNSLDEVSRIPKFIEDLGNSLSLSTKITMGIAVAIEEVIINIIQHAFLDNSQSEILLQVDIQPKKLKFIVVDEGIPLDPNRTIVSPKESLVQQIIQGKGHLLIHRIMDMVSYSTEDSKNQTVLIKHTDVDFKPEATLQTNICRVDGIIILNIEGRLDTPNATCFNKAIQPLLEEEQPNIIINCEQMTYISSSGLRSFLILQKSVINSNGCLAIEAMLPEIKHIFELTGFNAIFNIR